MPMQNDALVATFAHHRDAEAAIRKLDAARLDMKHFSIVGKDDHTEEKAIGFYSTGDLIRFWGQQGSIWGGLWGVFFGGMVVNISAIGPVMVVGHLTSIVFTAFEGAAETGRLGVLGSAFHRIGLPQASDIRYEDALKVDGFLVVAHGPAVEMAQAKTIVEATNPINIDLHQGVPAMSSVPDAPF